MKNKYCQQYIVNKYRLLLILEIFNNICRIHNIIVVKKLICRKNIRILFHIIKAITLNYTIKFQR